MSFQQMRARLDRLERSAKMNESKWKLPYEFTIDPALAKAIRSECDRLWEISILNMALGVHTTTSDLLIIEERIKEMVKGIRCPSEYDIEQHQKDRNRLWELGMKRRSPGGHLTSAEDDEEAQLEARAQVFNPPPYRQDRKTPPKPLTPEEENELNRVKSLCKVMPIQAGKPTVTCSDPKIKLWTDTW